MKKLKINEYKIWKDGTWCEVTKNGMFVYAGSCDANITCVQIFKNIKKGR